jgi:hypothetical protein
MWQVVVGMVTHACDAPPPPLERRPGPAGGLDTRCPCRRPTQRSCSATGPWWPCSRTGPARCTHPGPSRSQRCSQPGPRARRQRGVLHARRSARSRLAGLDAAVLPRGGRSMRAEDATRQTWPCSVAPAKPRRGGSGMVGSRWRRTRSTNPPPSWCSWLRPTRRMSSDTWTPPAPQAWTCSPAALRRPPRTTAAANSLQRPARRSRCCSARFLCSSSPPWAARDRVGGPHGDQRPILRYPQRHAGTGGLQVLARACRRPLLLIHAPTA